MKTKKDKTGAEYVAFSYRITIDKYEALKRLAKKNKRSVNSEIDIVIDKHLEENQPPTPPSS